MIDRMKRFKGHELGNIKDFKELLEKAGEFGDKVAFEYKKEIGSKNHEYVKHTFREYVQDAKNLGTEFLNMGLQGKRIAVIGNNTYAWCTTYISVVAGGMVIVPLDKALPDGEIKSLIKRSKVEAVVFDKKYLPVFEELKEEKSSNLQYYICNEKVEAQDILLYQDILEKGKNRRTQNDNSYDKIEIQREELSVMLFTSGTTAASKAVMLSQKNICEDINAMPYFVKIEKEDRILSFLPIHHTFECTITFLYGCLYSGATICFSDGLKYVVNNLKEYEITVFVSVPLMLELMNKKIKKGIEEQGKTKLISIMSKITNFLAKIHIDIRRKVYRQILENLGGKLRLILYGGAPMEKGTIVELSTYGIELAQGYGLTETSPVISAETNHYKRPGSSGLALINQEIKISEPNEDGIGEVTVKGPNVMIGYYENEEETKKVLKDGWFYTGDLGYLDKDGFLHLTGRKKDVIVLKNGKNIYPQELEFLISKLPIVQESMVYGKTIKNNDYLISAKIVYNEEVMQEQYPEKKEEEYHEIIWKEIKEKINTQIADYKHIKEIIVTKEPLIKTTTQKVKRAVEMQKIAQM